jgi:hypothetical protein
MALCLEYEDSIILPTDCTILFCFFDNLVYLLLQFFFFTLYMNLQLYDWFIDFSMYLQILLTSF